MNSDLWAIEVEYERRFSWWTWFPADEREAFMRAEIAGDEETLAKLTKLGERRELFEADQTCYHYFAWQETKPCQCDCMVRALEHDELVAYLDGDRVGLALFAQCLHRDPDYDIAGHIAAKKRERLERERREAEPKLDPEPRKLRDRILRRPKLEPEPVL